MTSAKRGGRKVDKVDTNKQKKKVKEGKQRDGKTKGIRGTKKKRRRADKSNYSTRKTTIGTRQIPEHGHKNPHHEQD